MTLDEAQELVAVVATICPGQPRSDFAAEGWQMVLDDVDYRQAVGAVRAIARSADARPLWIDPRQVLNQVRRDRTARLDRAELTGAPTAPAAYCEWLKSTRQQIASGNQTDAPALGCPAGAQKRPSGATETRSRVDPRGPQKGV
ncbi:hypothetical protein HMPREF1301_00217 [Propionibacterium sp. KPL2005]|nr:hypothetical protein HMPREF1301_00217 [Propionibacterium sp. KPL2005]ERS26731.1 hypothetical protein HMPREF1297_02321 [Propionibacterium sp. KPL2000]